MRAATVSLLAGLALWAGPAAPAELDAGGTVSAELRSFPRGPLSSEQLDSFQLTLTLEPYVFLRSADGKHRITLAPLVRWDGSDGERNRLDLREALWRGAFGDWEVVAGVDRVFWGVAESRHLVDVVNQTDATGSLDGEDKRGQPMLRVEWQRPWGRLTAMALFGFRERTFPGERGRLRPPLPVDTEHPHYPDGERAVDLALRYSHYFGDFDLGLSAFHGTGREPAFRPSAGGDRLQPVYSEITQLGLDLQYTRGAWLWKLEALARSGQGRTFGAAVVGFEYTLYQALGSAADLGLLVEYLYDGRDEAAPPTPFGHGLFLGARLALNDVDDTALLAGAVVDLERGSVAGRIEIERRITDFLSLELESRLFTGVDEGTPLSGLKRDSFAVVRASVSF